jgi:hypothetical protein
VATNFAGEPLSGSRRLVLVALRGIAAAVLLGTGMVMFVLWGVGALVAAAPRGGPITGGPMTGAPVTGGPPLLLLLGGTLLALLASAATAWACLAPLDSYYRRGGLAMVSAFATFVTSVLAAPLHYFLGPRALLCVGAGALAGAVLLLRMSPTAGSGGS